MTIGSAILLDALIAPDLLRQQAFERQEALMQQRNRLTREYFELGRMLHEFDRGGYWAFIADPREDQTDRFIGFPSFDQWLKNTSELGTTTSRYALQSYRLWVLELGVPLTVLEQVDLSKYVDINPVAKQIRKDYREAQQGLAAVREQIQAEFEPATQPVALARVANEEATLYQRAQSRATEWVLLAQQSSRRDIRARRGYDEGWIVESVVCSYDELPDKMKPLYNSEGGDIFITGKQSITQGD